MLPVMEQFEDSASKPIIPDHLLTCQQVADLLGGCKEYDSPYGAYLPDYHAARIRTGEVCRQQASFLEQFGGSGSLPPTAHSKSVGHTSSDGGTVEPETDAVMSDRAGGDPKQIPAAAFAALVGRSLRTLRNWDELGLTHPEVRSSRRYYGPDDLAAALSSKKGRKGPREGSMINYLASNWDGGT